MQNILYLVHRIPYPPNKGDKIRSFHFLKALAEHYHVYLGAFIDDEEDWQYTEHLKSYCSDSLCLALKPSTAKVKSLTGLLTKQALSLPYYQNQTMQYWVDEIIASRNIEKVVIFSSVMAQFVLHKNNVDMIVDFVDVDSDKWQQYAQKKRWPESWIYHRESRRLLDFEKKVTEKAKISFFVSQQEAELFKRLAPAVSNKVTAINNGVDAAYFSPQSGLLSPYKDHEKAIVFTGAMDYWPNVDAVVWFAQQVFPEICRQHPQTAFYIVGSKPTKEVQALETQDNIVVTGRVEDIRPYLAFAMFAVAPLRIARGIQNKVLEAMSMEKTVLATSAAMEGISGYEQQDVIMTDDAGQLADKACQLLSQPQIQSSKNRAFVKAQFSWNSSGKQLAQLIND